MTITLTLPDELYQSVLEIAGLYEISAERMAVAAVAEQVAQWERMERLAANATREQFLAVLDKAPDREPAPEDRL